MFSDSDSFEPRRAGPPQKSSGVLSLSIALARNPYTKSKSQEEHSKTTLDNATKEALNRDALFDFYVLALGIPAVISIAKKDAVLPDEVDERDTGSAKNVPSFLRGAPPGVTTTKRRKHLWRDIEG